MKKLLIASIVMLATLTACQNSNDEIISTPVGKEKVTTKSTARENEVWEKPSEDPYALDGYTHIVLDKNIAVYMGEELRIANEEEYREIVSIVENQSNSKRTGMVYCQASYQGITVSLVVVQGDGLPPTYWVVESGNGQTSTYVWENPHMGSCGSLHFHAMMNGGI